MSTIRLARSVLGVGVVIGVTACAAQNASGQGAPNSTAERPQRVEIVDVPPSLKPSDKSLWIATSLGLASAAIAIVGAYEFAKRSRVDTFRALRESFFKLRTDKTGAGLPTNWATADLNTAITADDFEGLKRYWLNAFDEWFITKYARPWLYKSLWTEYYENVLQRAAQRPLMLIALCSAFQGSAQSKADQAFVKAMLALAGKERCQKLREEFKKWADQELQQGAKKETIRTTLAPVLHVKEDSLDTLLKAYEPQK